MTQVLPLSQLALSAAEDFEEQFIRAASDGVIDDQELSGLTPELRLVVVKVDSADLARALTQAVCKGGIGCRRSRDLLKQIREDDEPEAA